MFEKFTESARQAVVAAQEEARSRRYGYVGTEHLLIGLIAADGLAAHVLDGLGVDLERARGWLDRAGAGIEPPPAPVGQLPFSPLAKKALEQGLREALGLGHNYVGGEHLLLALAWPRDGDEKSAARRMLDDLDVAGPDVREAVIAALSSRPSERSIGVRFVGKPPPAGRCEQAFTLHGALFLCQKEAGHPGGHVEHGNGWTMAWEPE